MTFFTNEIVPAVFQVFIGYIAEKFKGESVQGTEMGITRVYSCINRCLNLLIVKEYRGRGNRKEFIQIFLKYVKLATEQLVGKIKTFVEEWVPCELEVQKYEVGGEENISR